MAVDLLHVGVNALGDGVGHQMGNVTPERRADAGEGVVGSVDNGVIAADSGQEVLHTLRQRTLGSELMAAHGPDSYIGRCAAVMLGCTETTFYTIAVYFGAAGIRRTRYTIPAALTADLAGFMAAAWSVRLFFGA